MRSTPVRSLRFVLFLGVVLIHVLAYFILSHIIIFRANSTATEDQAQQFQMVHIPMVQPPPPSPAMSMPSLVLSTPATHMPPIPITVTQAQFNIPKPEMSSLGVAMLNRLPGQGQIAGDNASGSTKPSESGSGNGDMADICGLKISTSETVVAFEDVWQTKHNRLIKSQEDRDKVLRYAERCISKFFFGVTPVQVDGSCTFYNPAAKNVQSTGDFFQAAYPLEDQGPDGKKPSVMLFISDWAGGSNKLNDPYLVSLQETASAAFVDSLRKRHIKLYLLSTELTPNHILINYAKESGGQVSITPQPPLSELTP